jgi:hypothetical protein
LQWFLELPVFVRHPITHVHVKKSIVRQMVLYFSFFFYKLPDIFWLMLMHPYQIVRKSISKYVMLKKILVSAILFSGTLFGVRAQIAPKPLSAITDVVPASPDVSAIARYGGIPINRSTGAVNYSLPLVSISAGKLSYALGLSYGAEGIKVDQTASRTGLGWVLNGTGVVSRTIMDEPDEFATRITAPSSLGHSRALLDFLAKGIEQTDGFDNQPDVFSFSVNGISGKFVLDAQGNVQQIPKTTLRIETNFSGTGYNIKITDQTGIAYYFGGTAATEYTKTLNNGLGCGSNRPTLNDGAPTAWYLTRIEHPLGKNPGRDNLQFSYTAVTFSYPSGVSQTQIRTPTNTTLTGCDFVGGTIDACPTIYENTTCVSTLQTNGYYLSGVTSSDGSSIQLSYLAGRLDLPGDVSLTGVELFNSRNERIRKFVLDFEQIQSTNPMLSSLVGSPTGATYRMYLKKLTEYGRTGVPLGNHDFRYYLPSALPARLSFSQDHFGFFNGQQNTSLIGAPSYMLPTLMSPFETGNRESSTTHFAYGMLSGITYPTKGRDSLVYEANILRESTLVEPPSQNVPLSVRGVGQSGSVTAQSQDFYIAYTQTTDLGYSTDTFEGTGYQYDPLHNFGRIQLYDITAGTYVVNLLKVNPPSVNSVRVVLTAGHTYRFTLTSFGDIVRTDGSISYRNGTPTTQMVDKVVGGARLARSISYDGNTQVLYKRYKYTEIDGTSSGVRAQSAPQYYGVLNNNKDCSIYGQVGGYTDCWGTTCTYITGHSNSTVSLFGSMGSHVYYQSCLESNGGDDFEGGGIQARYSFSPENPALVFLGQEIQNTPMSNFSWQSGDEIYSLHFKKKNGEVIKVKETDRHFTIAPGQSAVRGYMIKKNFSVRCVSDVQITPDEWEFSPYDAAYYELISGWKYLDQETVTDYDLNGTNPIVVQNSYTYNPSTQLMSSTSRLLSDGSTRSAEYFYSADYASVPGLDPAQASILSQMNVTGNTAAPVLTLSKVNGNVIEASRIDYQYSPQTNHIVPSVINTFNTVSQTYEPTVRLQAFNEADRLTMTSKSEASPVSYHWRSDNTSPNAMANNASPSEFYSENYEEDPSSTVGLAHSGNRYTTSTSVGWAAPNGKTYLISYWYRLSGKWYQSRTGYNGTAHTLSGGDAYDDVNIYPTDAQVTSYTFEPLVGMTSQTDAKGLSTFYEYDGFGRLLLVKDHNGDIIKHLAYNYAILAVSTYGNDAISQVFTRSNCVAGQIPGQITYTVQANTYTAASKSAANALAQADINTNGQAFANANAVCTTCSGNDKKIINGICQTGVKVYISSIPKPGGVYQCRYHYQFSDNTFSIEYVEQNMPSPCIPE